jgi:hypothetical protein
MNFFELFLNPALTPERARSYTPAIDGDAADAADAVRTFSRLLGRSYSDQLRSERNGFGAAKVVRPRLSLSEILGFPSRRCCLTIESEERETWTAEVLADLSLWQVVKRQLTVTYLKHHDFRSSDRNSVWELVKS